MNNSASATPTEPPRKRGRPVGKSAGGATLGQDASRDARRVAAAILEVLAGARTPIEAASALTLSLPRYYQVETQALRGLVSACEPRPRGRQASPTRDLAVLQKENERLRREAARHQALVRAAQRSIGLAPPPPAPARPSGKKPRRRRLARGLAAAARLQSCPSDNALSQPAAAAVDPQP
jgi:hypothetical protein